jgi:eukaryotic-like serine/threonine-protein kinase
MAKKARWEFREGDEIVPELITLKPLGGGSRYEVYIAWHERLQSAVVAKIVRPDQVHSDSALRGLRREAKMLRRLSHPVIVRSFGAVVEGARPHIVLEHVEGPTLKSLLKKDSPVPLDQILPLALHIGAALHYMAAEGRVHLDVKPGNIVMGAPPRLIDLSLARTVEQAAKLKRRVGTRLYMAPEQYEAGHGAEIGPPADVWGLGITLYEAIAGRLPFAAGGSEGDSAAYPQLHGSPEPLPKNVPPVLSQQVLQCLRRDPLRRPSASDLSRALGAARGLDPAASAAGE